MSAENTNAGGGEPKPGDLTFCSTWETKRQISHQEAREIASRLIASHFRRGDTEQARIGIPARPDYDDDLLINSYIKQQARKDAALSAHSTGSGGVAAEPVAGNLRDALAPFAAAWQSCQDLGDQGAGYVQDDQDAWVSGNRNGGAHPLFKFGDLRRAAEALAAAPTPPAGGGETESLFRQSLADHPVITETLRAAEPSPASPASDLISLSYRLHKLAHALWNDSDCRTDWSVEAMEIWKGLVALAPAAPRKGPTEEEIARAQDEAYEQYRFHGEGYTNPSPWMAFKAGWAAALALLTPADRGETQAVGDGADV